MLARGVAENALNIFWRDKPIPLQEYSSSSSGDTTFLNSRRAVSVGLVPKTFINLDFCSRKKLKRYMWFNAIQGCLELVWRISLVLRNLMGDNINLHTKSGREQSSSNSCGVVAGITSTSLSGSKYPNTLSRALSTLSNLALIVSRIRASTSSLKSII